MTDKVFNWEDVKDRIELVVRNKSMLKEDEAYLSPCAGDDGDIVCVFRIKIDDSASAIVNKELLLIWKKNIYEVAYIASYNSFTKYRPSIVTFGFDSKKGGPCLKFYDVTTELKNLDLVTMPYLTISYKENEPNGAASAFLGVLNDISDLYNDGGDLLLIFTSIHECMIHKIKDASFLNGILDARNAGYEFLIDDERLTDKPYVYEAKTHQVMTYYTYQEKGDQNDRINVSEI